MVIVIARFFKKNLPAQKMGKIGKKQAKNRVFKIYWKIKSLIFF